MYLTNIHQEKTNKIVKTFPIIHTYIYIYTEKCSRLSNIHNNLQLIDFSKIIKIPNVYCTAHYIYKIILFFLIISGRSG